MPKKGTAETAEIPAGILMLDPAAILADDNTRYGLKSSRIESLARSITERGEVMEPVEIEPLATASNGHKYRLTTGFYRHAAVKYLNETAQAGLTLPCIVRQVPDNQERLRRQLAENMERENQSPMDQAIAIKRLLDNGLSKMQVREIFSRPGGRKGNKTQPASNSFINMTLSFLDLHKNIQEKIHVGAIGIAAAYELTKVPAEKRQAVLERAEQEREKALAREERDEEAILKAEKKQSEANVKRDALHKATQEAEAKHNTATETLQAKTVEAGRLYEIFKGKHATPKDKKAAEKAFRESEKARQIAEADATAATQEFEAAQVKLTKYDTLISEKATQLKQARAATLQGAAKKKKGEAVGPQDVKKAAKATKASSNAVPLNASEMRKVVNELALPGGDPKIIAIGQALIHCFAGETTDKQLYAELAKIVA